MLIQSSSAGANTFVLLLLIFNTNLLHCLHHLELQHITAYRSVGGFIEMFANLRPFRFVIKLILILQNAMCFDILFMTNKT